MKMIATDLEEAAEAVAIDVGLRLESGTDADSCCLIFCSAVPGAGFFVQKEQNGCFSRRPDRVECPHHGDRFHRVVGLEEARETLDLSKHFGSGLGVTLGSLVAALFAGSP